MFSSTRVLGVAALVAAFAVPAAVLAQQAPAAPAGAVAPLASPAPGARPHHHGNAYMRALRTLDLSDAQKQQIKTAVQQMRAANQNADPATHKANGEKLRAQIDAILTPDQRTRLQAAIEQQRQMMPPSTRGAAPIPAPSTTP